MDSSTCEKAPPYFVWTFSVSAPVQQNLSAQILSSYDHSPRLLFPDEAISPSFLSAPSLYLMGLSLCTVGTQRVLTCYLNNWWIELDHPDSNEETGLISDRMALRYGEKKTPLKI